MFTKFKNHFIKNYNHNKMIINEKINILNIS